MCTDMCLRCATKKYSIHTFFPLQIIEKRYFGMHADIQSSFETFSIHCWLQCNFFLLTSSSMHLFVEKCKGNSITILVGIYRQNFLNKLFNFSAFACAYSYVTKKTLFKMKLYVSVGIVLSFLFVLLVQKTHRDGSFVALYHLWIFFNFILKCNNVIYVSWEESYHVSASIWIHEKSYCIVISMSTWMEKNHVGFLVIKRHIKRIRV